MCRMKRKLLSDRAYCRVSVLSVNMSHPVSIFQFAQRVKQIIKRIDVLYLNNSVVHIESMDWNVMYETLRRKHLSYLFTAGRANEDGKYMITPINLGVGESGIGIEFCQQVLGPFILVSRQTFLILVYQIILQSTSFLPLYS